MAVSADLWLGGFDTHANHDANQGALRANLTDSADYLWDYAEAHCVADRLVVVIGSCELLLVRLINATQAGKRIWLNIVMDDDFSNIGSG